MIGLLIRILFLSGLLLSLGRLLSDRVLNKEKSYRDANRRDIHPHREDSDRTILKKTPHTATARAQSADKHDEGTSEIEKAIAKWTKRLAVFTGALAFFTLVAAGASIYQSIILSGQLGEMQSASTIAVKTAERQLRAYIQIEDVELRCPLCRAELTDINSPIPRTRIFENIIIANLRNGGQTPAYKLRCSSAIHEIPGAGNHLPPEFDYADAPIQTIFPWPWGVDTINANRMDPLQSTLNESSISGFIRATKHEVSRIYYGHCDYTDVFSRERSSPFCYEYLPDLIRKEGEAGRPFALCADHNTPQQEK